MIYRLDLGLFEDESSLQSSSWKDITEMIAHVLLIPAKSARVYLYVACSDVQTDPEHFPITVTHNPELLCEVITSKSVSLYPCHFLQEYESYEAAYEVSLAMMETHPLCYDESFKDN